MKTKSAPWSPVSSLRMAAAGGFLLVSGSLASAAVVFNLDFVICDQVDTSPPAGPTPWLEATAQQAGSNQVTLTLSAGGLVGPEHVTLWYFNLNPAYDPANLSFTYSSQTGTFVQPVIATGTDAFKADGDGDYDILFTFDTSDGDANHFGADESVTYTLSLTGGSLLESDLYFPSHNPAHPACPDFFSAAHVLSTGQDAAFSSWIAAIPEPGSAWLAAACSSLFALRRRRI